MTQARRKSKRKSARSRGAGAGWGMLLIGLVSGAVLTTLYLGAQSGDDSRLGSGLKILFQKNASTAGAHRSGDAGAANPPPPTAKFDFYTVLPEIERVIPDADFDGDDRDSDQHPRAHSQYVLQAASYANFADADRLKAKLALSGFEPSIQKVTVEGKGVFFRVRLGPYANKRQLKNARQQLAKLGINALPLTLTSQ